MWNFLNAPATLFFQKNQKTRTLVWLLLLCRLLAGAQEAERFDFKMYGFEEGLSHRNVFKIGQDSTGFLWIGTINGLNRFDGKKFRHFTTGNSAVPHNFITDLWIENRHNIWLAYPGGISAFDPRKVSLKNFKPDSASILRDVTWKPNNFFRISKKYLGCIGQDNRPGTLVLLRTTEPDRLEDMLTLPNKSALVPAIFWDNKLVMEALPGEVWLMQGLKIEKAILKNTQNSIVAFQTDQDNRLFALLTDGSIFSLDPETTTFQPYLDNNFPFKNENLQTFLLEENGDLWLGGYAALWHYQASSQRWENYHTQIKQLVKNTCQVRQVFKDNSGVLWAATDFGLLKITPSQKLFDSYLSDGNEYCNNGYCSMRAMTEGDDGAIYMSYYNSIHKLNPRTGELRPLFPKKDFFNPPFGLLFHRDQLFTGNGLRIRLSDLKTDTLIRTGVADAGVLTTDGEQNIWLGFEDKLYSYNFSEDRLNLFKDPKGVFERVKNDLSFLLYSRFGKFLWVGTNNNGLFKIDPEAGTLEHFTNAQHSKVILPSNRILGVAETAPQLLWLATSNGLCKINLSDFSSKTYAIQDGLPNNFINAVQSEGDSALWASTDRGLARLSFNTGKIVYLLLEDGLRGKEFNRNSFLKSRDGRFYFGGLNGVIAFYPNAAFWKPKKTSDAPLLLTSFTKYNNSKDSLFQYPNPEDLSGGIQMRASDKFFIFEFALLDFKNPTANAYTYKLEGFDKEWSAPSNETTVRYNNIPAGTYRFRVKASTGGSQWNASEISIPVIIKPAFYTTWWFLALCLIFLAAIIFGWVRWREYELRRREKQLEREVFARTQELQEEKQKSEDLLLNILPYEIADELKKYGRTKARRYEMVTVMFSDFKDFSQIASQMEPEQLVQEIDFCFRKFDEIIGNYGLEKIKTIGDAYMCAGGIGIQNDTIEACNVVAAAIDIQAFMSQMAEDKKKRGQPFFEARIGIHSGPVVAGIVGIKKFAYDIWGDTVNIASRMETASSPGRVNISETTYGLIKNQFDFEPNGRFLTKHKGEISMYFAIPKK